MSLAVRKAWKLKVTKLFSEIFMHICTKWWIAVKICAQVMNLNSNLAVFSGLSRCMTVFCIMFFPLSTTRFFGGVGGLGVGWWDGRVWWRVKQTSTFSGIMLCFAKVIFCERPVIYLGIFIVKGFKPSMQWSVTEAECFQQTTEAVFLSSD